MCVPRRIMCLSQGGYCVLSKEDGGLLQRGFCVFYPGGHCVLFHGRHRVIFQGGRCVLSNKDVVRCARGTLCLLRGGYCVFCMENTVSFQRGHSVFSTVDNVSFPNVKICRNDHTETCTPKRPPRNVCAGMSVTKR